MNEIQTKNGNGLRALLRANWFPLIVWFLSQAVTVGLTFGGFMLSNYLRMTHVVERQIQLFEWKGGIDAILKRMDDEGTTKGKYTDEEQNKQLADLQSRMKVQEYEGRHWEVIETEHKHLTEDVAELKHGKK